MLAIGGAGLLAGLTGFAGGDPSQNGSGTPKSPTNGPRTNEHGAMEFPDDIVKNNYYIPTPINDPIAPQTVEMQMEVGGGHYFNPNIVWVPKGGTVTWEIVEGGHSSTAMDGVHSGDGFGDIRRIPDGADGWDSGVLGKGYPYSTGTTYSHTFDTVGVYDYHCRPHGELGMVGKVVVGWPSDLSREPAMRPPSPAMPDTAANIVRALTHRTVQMFTLAAKNGKIHKNGDDVYTKG